MPAMPAPRRPLPALPSSLTARAIRWSPLGLLLAAAALAYGLFGRASVEVVITTKRWQRDIEIERRVEQFGTAWCAELPADARHVERRLARDPRDGRMAEHCRYTAAGWRAVRSLHSEGLAPTSPHWPPEPEQALAAGSEAGPERLGKRHELYELQLRAATGQQWQCRLPQSHWESLSAGQMLRLKIDRHGVVDCSSIPRPAG